MFKDKSAKDAVSEEVVGEMADDMVFDAPSIEEGEEQEIEDVEEDMGEKLKKYKEKLKVCQKERQEYLDGWQRSKADYLNQKRRLETGREQEIERNAIYSIEKLLPLCDSFDLALQNLAREKEAKPDWRTGIEQIYNQLLGILKSYDVEVLVPLGNAFDPHFHEAVSETLVTNAAQHHIILDVLQNGYAVGERLIRPAKVVVGNFVSDKGK